MCVDVLRYILWITVYYIICIFLYPVTANKQQCLKESKSDILLEKCRRAFKKVEGGGGE